MDVLITGGAGFIGRWVVKKFLDNGDKVIAFDNLANGSLKNIEQFMSNNKFKFIKGDILDKNALTEIFKTKVDLCLHLAAEVKVHDSIQDPNKHFNVNVVGTQNILNLCHKKNTKLVLMSTCMIYDTIINEAIKEEHPIRPASPYAGSKAAAEFLAMSYYFAYKMPVIILRPFNTYGPFQKRDMEGGVVSIFLKRKLAGMDLEVFGDGTQTRDFLYVEDCADFALKAALSEKAIGEVINAGYGTDTSINDLAYLIVRDNSKIRHIEHHHPQSEIMKLQCDNSKAKKLLHWEPMTKLEEGLKKTEEWIKLNDAF